VGETVRWQVEGYKVVRMIRDCYDAETAKYPWLFGTDSRLDDRARPPLPDTREVVRAPGNPRGASARPDP
jgi:hypothetical protein